MHKPGDRVTVKLPDHYREDWKAALNGARGEVVLVRGEDVDVMFYAPVTLRGQTCESFWFDASELVPTT